MSHVPRAVMQAAAAAVCVTLRYTH